MTISVLVSAVWLSCMLAAVVLAMRPAVRATDLLFLAVPFVLVWGLGRVITVQAGWAGVTAAVLVGWRLLQGGSANVDRLTAGLLAGLATALHAAHGVSAPLAAAFSLPLLAGAALLGRNAPGTRRPAFDGLLVLVAWTAPVIGLAPEVAAGWKAAGAMNLPLAGAASKAIPAWSLAFIALALLAGALRAVWIRK